MPCELFSLAVRPNSVTVTISVFFHSSSPISFRKAAIAVFNTYGRAALCGAISTYNATTPPPGPNNMFQIVGKRLTLRGYIITDHGDRHPDFVREVGPLVASGQVKYRETVVDGGVEAAPQAFIDLLRGANTGKMVVRL